MITYKIPIWGEVIPGNSSALKISDLDVGKKGLEIFMIMKAAMAMSGVKIKDPLRAKKALDTYQYYHEIAAGFRPQTYEDIPCIDFYPCEKSRKAVLIIPGGGYTYQSNSGVEPEKQYEGGAMALMLNKAGFSAFVLSCYRLNPYRMPIPFLDAQRAVRYIKYHAEEFGIDPAKLGIMGFSAGGLQAASVIDMCKNKSVQEIAALAGRKDLNYCEDEVDRVDAGCAFAGLIYPMLGFRSNLPMMYAAFPKRDVDQPKKREALLKQYDMTGYVEKDGVPRFLVMGTKDAMVDLTDDKSRYMAALEKAGNPCQYLAVDGAGHGFGVLNKKYAYWTEEYIKWLNTLH